MKWVRKKNGSRDLQDDDSLLAVIEPARCRGHWWWTTWANRPNYGGYAFSLDEAHTQVVGVLGPLAARRAKHGGGT